MTFYFGDCLDEMKKIPDGSVSMVLCDLPYGTTARNEWDKKIPLEPLWEQWKRIPKGSSSLMEPDAVHRRTCDVKHELVSL